MTCLLCQMPDMLHDSDLLLLTSVLCTLRNAAAQPDSLRAPSIVRVTSGRSGKTAPIPAPFEVQAACLQVCSTAS